MSHDLTKNKIAASILLAGLIAMIAGKVTEFLYDGGPKHPGHHEEVRGYTIDVPETIAGATQGTAAVVTAADISALYPQADVAAGEAYFQKKCVVCHNIEKGAPHKVGPNVYGVMGRKVAALPDFNYSEAMKSYGDRTWNWEEMNQFQFAPRKWVPGTIMAFAGTPKDQERANLIVYLNSKSDNPLPLPPVTEKKEPDVTPADSATISETGKEHQAAPADARVSKPTPRDSGNKASNATPDSQTQGRLPNTEKKDEPPGH